MSLSHGYREVWCGDVGLFERIFYERDTVA